MYINESFDTIFNIDFGAEKSPMDERVKVMINVQSMNTLSFLKQPLPPRENHVSDPVYEGLNI